MSFKTFFFLVFLLLHVFHFEVKSDTSQLPNGAEKSDPVAQAVENNVAADQFVQQANQILIDEANRLRSEVIRLRINSERALVRIRFLRNIQELSSEHRSRVNEIADQLRTASRRVSANDANRAPLEEVAQGRRALIQTVREVNQNLYSVLREYPHLIQQEREAQRRRVQERQEEAAAARQRAQAQASQARNQQEQHPQNQPTQEQNSQAGTAQKRPAEEGQSSAAGQPPNKSSRVESSDSTASHSNDGAAAAGEGTSGQQAESKGKQGGNGHGGGGSGGAEGHGAGGQGTGHGGGGHAGGHVGGHGGGHGHGHGHGK